MAASGVLSEVLVDEGKTAAVNTIVAPGLAHQLTRRGNCRQQVFFREEDCPH